jgi:hypothetical protein
MTAAPAKVTAAPAAPKGKSFSHRPRHHARRKRGFEAEPKRDRRYENFRDPASHGALLRAPVEL